MILLVIYNNKIMCLMMNDVALFNTRKKFLYEQNFIDADWHQQIIMTMIFALEFIL